MTKRRPPNPSPERGGSDSIDPITPEVDEGMNRGTVKLIKYATKHFGSRWVRLIEDIFEEFASMDTSKPPDLRLQLYYAASLFEFSPSGSPRTIAESFLLESRTSLSKLQRVDRGADRRLVDDMGRHCRRPRQERHPHRSADRRGAPRARIEGSKTMLPGYTLLARVADLPGVSLLAGAHPQTLPRSIAMTIIGQIRRSLDARRVDARPESRAR